MADEGPGGRRLPCPCSARHARAARTQALSAVAVAGLVAVAVLGSSSVPVRAHPAADRIILIAIAVLGAGAFAVLQAIARSQRRRWSAFADWRTWPPGHDPWAECGHPMAGRHEGSAYRPGYGFLPRPGTDRSLDA